MKAEEGVTGVTLTETSVRCSQTTDDLVMMIHMGQACD